MTSRRGSSVRFSDDLRDALMRQAGFLRDRAVADLEVARGVDDLPVADPNHTAGGYPTGRERREVPIDVIREAFHESGLSVRELARRMKLHHSGVGRMVSGWKAHQYKANAAGERVRYKGRTLSVKRETAVRYLAGMGLEPAEIRERLDALG